MGEEKEKKEMIEVYLISELEEVLKMNLKSRHKVVLVEETIREVKERLGIK